MTAVKKSPAGTKKAAPAKKGAVVDEGRAAKKATGHQVHHRQEGTTGQEGRPRQGHHRQGSDQEGHRHQVDHRQEGRHRPRRPPPAKKAAPTKAPPRRAKAPAAKAAAAKKAATGQEGRAKAPAKAVKKAAPEPPKRPTVGPYAKDTKFLDAQRVLLLEERTIYAGQAVDLRAEADSLALEREPGDVQFDEESGEGGTVTVDRERNLALSAQATAAVEEIDDALRKIDRKYLRWLRALFPADPQGPPPGAALRPTVRRLQEWWPVTALTDETAVVTGDDHHGTPPTGPAKLAVAVGVVTAVVLADQLTKWWAVDRLASGPVHVFWRLDFAAVHQHRIGFQPVPGGDRRDHRGCRRAWWRCCWCWYGGHPAWVGRPSSG